MKRLVAVTIAALLAGQFAGPAFAQTTPVPRYGEADKAKSPGEIEREEAAEKAYKRSLSNVPNAGGATDPWGTIRNDGAAKPATKSTQPKQAKSKTPTN